MALDVMAISKEWATRPYDQRFLSMEDLHKFNMAKARAAVQANVNLRALRLVADKGQIALTDPAKGGAPALLNHWSFGQLCQRSAAPASYLRDLPPELAIIPLQWSLEQAEENNAKLLLRRGAEGGWRTDAVSSQSYGRIFDEAVSGAILKHVDLETWKVPSASYASSNPKKATTLYASDRDMFVALVDDQHPIEMPGGDKLFKGFIARNSEVGACAFDFIGFLYRYICDNRIIWGGSELFSIKIRHSSGGPARYFQEAAPMISRYLNSGTATTVAQLQEARKKEVAKDEPGVLEWLKARGFADGLAQRAMTSAQNDPSLNPRSIWGIVQGLTSAAQDIGYNADRLDLERKAGKLLDLVKL